MKQREFWVSLNTFNDGMVHVREVSPERDQLFEEMRDAIYKIKIDLIIGCPLYQKLENLLDRHERLKDETDE